MLPEDQEKFSPGGGSLLPVTTPKTRRRALDYNEYAEEDGSSGSHSLQQSQYNRSPRRRINLMIKCLWPRWNAAICFFGALILFILSTMVLKIMLMSSFNLRVNARMKSNHFWRRPQPLEASSSVVLEKTIHPLHDEQVCHLLPFKQRDNRIPLYASS